MISAAQASARRIDDSMAGRTMEHLPRTGAKPVRRAADAAGREQNAKGRGAHGVNEAGHQRIIDGLRRALRSRQNIHVTRKDIAEYAGVTPALVTYYYAEKDTLIEAATLPVVEMIVARVEKCLLAPTPIEERLLEAIGFLIDSYARDAALIDLFAVHQASKTDTLPDLLGRLDAALEAFFDHWLQQTKNSVFDAAYLQKVVIGMCKIVARGRVSGVAHGAPDEARSMIEAQAICSIVLTPMARADRPELLALKTASDRLRV